MRTDNGNGNGVHTPEEPTTEVAIVLALKEREGEAVTFRPPRLYEPDTTTAIYRARFGILGGSRCYHYDRWSDLVRSVRNLSGAMDRDTLTIDVGILRLTPSDTLCQILDTLEECNEEVEPNSDGVISWVPVQVTSDDFEDPESSIGSDIRDVASLKADIEWLSMELRKLEVIHADHVEECNVR